MEMTVIKVAENGKVKYLLILNGETRTINTVRTPLEIDKEVAKLKKLRKRVQKFNNIGDNNHDIILSEISVLNTGS